MFCTKCGNEMNDGSEFCEKCGHGRSNENDKDQDNNQSHQKPKKNKVSNIIISIISTIAFIYAIFAIVNAFKDLSGSGSSSKKLDAINVTMTVDYSEYLGYSAKVTGTIVNNTGKDFSYVSIEYSIYDAAGNNLGTALDNINNLAAGDTWKFEANLFSYPNSRPTSYRFIEISSW